MNGRKDLSKIANQISGQKLPAAAKKILAGWEEKAAKAPGGVLIIKYREWQSRGHKDLLIALIKGNWIQVNELCIHRNGFSTPSPVCTAPEKVDEIPRTGGAQLTILPKTTAYLKENYKERQNE